LALICGKSYQSIDIVRSVIFVFVVEL